MFGKGIARPYRRLFWANPAAQIRLLQLNQAGDTKMDSKFFAPRLALLACLIVPSTAMAGTAEVLLTSKMRISFLGFNVGVLNQNIKVADKSYEIKGGAKSNAVVSIISDAKAQFSSAGHIEGYRLIPAVQKLTYKSGRKSGHLNVDFENGGVSTVQASPKIKYKSGTVPVEKAHLERVVDPVSSILFPVKPQDVGDGRKVCKRVLPVFDGRSRMNLVFDYKSTQSGRAKGFHGKTFTCSVRYQPISGMRPHKKNVKFMRANRNMEVTMARVGDSNVYAIFSFKVRTTRGMASGSAYQFSTQ